MRTNSQRGDTIIEVLLAMAVIGMTLGIAYGIANRAILTGQNAQERTTALSLAETQLERLKDNLNSDTPPDYTAVLTAFCVLDGLPVVDASVSGSACTGVDGSFYDLRMEYSSGPPEVYRSVVLWDDPGRSIPGDDETRNRVELLYRP